MAGRQTPDELEQKLAGDLLKIRRDGLHRYSTRLHRLEALQWIAQTAGQGEGDYAKLLDVLERLLSGSATSTDRPRELCMG